MYHLYAYVLLDLWSFQTATSNHQNPTASFPHTITRSPSASDVGEQFISTRTSELTYPETLMFPRPWICCRCNDWSAAVNIQCSFCAHQRCGKSLKVFEADILYDGLQDSSWPQNLLPYHRAQLSTLSSSLKEFFPNENIYAPICETFHV